MLSENEFQLQADKILVGFFDAIEANDVDGEIECELQAGILTLLFQNGKQIIVNKHAPSGQIWLSSPLSGGLHFARVGEGWALADGRTLAGVLSQDIQTLAGIEISL